tara:strand:+ start:309 stop:482 length:174 start_codon:yes stop_codon:yes gene_type:complete
LIAFDSGGKHIRMLVGQKLYVFTLSKLNEVNQKEIVELNNGFKAHYKRVQQTQKKEF